MAKLKVKLARRQDDCDPAVVSWLQAHDIRFSDRKHYADLPQVPEGSLYDTDSDVTGVAMKHYLCPLSRDIMVYHTLDHRHLLHRRRTTEAGKATDGPESGGMRGVGRE